MEGLVDKATSEALVMPDWGLNMEISDRISVSDAMCKDAARAVGKRLAHKNPKVVLLAFTLLDCLVKNAGQKFHSAAAGKDAAIAESIAAHASGKSGHSDPEVRASAASLLQEMSIAFGPQASTTPWKATFDRLSAAGVSFPSIDPATVTVYPVPQLVADPNLLAARAAAVPPPLPGSSQLGLPSGLQSQAQRLAPAAMQAQQQQHVYHAPPGMAGPSVGMGYPMGPAYGAPTAGRGVHGGGYAVGGGGGQYPPPMQQHMHRQMQPPGLASLPVEQQLAAVDSAFEKLRADMRQVRRVIAEGAKEGVAGRTGPAADAWLDAVDFCAQALPRLAALVEIGVQGILDEGLFEDCLAVNEGAARVAQAGEADIGGRGGPEAVGKVYSELQDLVDFDKPRPAAVPASGAGSEDLLGLPPPPSSSTPAPASASAQSAAASASSAAGSAAAAPAATDPFADISSPGPSAAASSHLSASTGMGRVDIGFDDFASSTGSAAAVPAPAAATGPSTTGGGAAADPSASLSSFDAPVAGASSSAAGGAGSSTAAQAQKSSVEDEIDDLLK